MAEAGAASGLGLAFAEPLILLGAAVVAVPLARRIGLGSVLGYLAAGVFIGPVARLIAGAEEILHVAELGVVFFLFIVGLELRPARLWAMRTDIFGLGLAQVVLTGLLLTLILGIAGWRLEPAFIIGFGLALSSTAFGMQILQERNGYNQTYGQKALAILLFQDLAIVPLLAVVPMLSPYSGDNGSSSGWFQESLEVLGAVAALYLAGRYLLNPFFRLLALTQAREIMTAAALFVVLGAAALMDLAGMSMAMGAFIAGVLLADSTFRHELEANIEPFRGLLLGLFFMAVGMAINIDSVLYSWWRILLAVPVVMVAKAGVLYGVSRMFGTGHNDAVRVAMLLPQAGEFAFALFASAAAVRALWPSDTSFVAAVVTVTMALTPLSVWLGNKLIRQDEEELDEDFEGAGGQVLVIGFGRFGQVASQVLLARNIETTIIDSDAKRIREATRFGFRIYFGDGRRRDVLRAAGAKDADVICVCVNDAAVATRIVDLCQTEFPTAAIYVRSWDRAHTIELVNRGVAFEMRETYESAVVFGGEALRGLGYDAEAVAETVEDVRRRDADRLALQLGGDVVSGADVIHPDEVHPEPLVRPAREAEVLNKADTSPDRATDRRRQPVSEE